MLRITIPGAERFDDQNQEFLIEEENVLELEHSLVSLSKWEEFFEKPFLTPKPHSSEEVEFYIKCMILNAEIPPGVFQRMTQQNLDDIDAYINRKMTATWFSDKSKPTREVITSELIYYWMFSAGIPKECETWHLNKLFTLLKVFSLKNEPPKKMGSAELARRNRELNERRKAQLGTSG